MNDAVENILSLFGFGADILTNNPAFDLPIPSATIAVVGLILVLFAAFKDIIQDFSTFHRNANVMIAVCLAVMSYPFYLKNKDLALAICMFLCLVIRVCEATVVGRMLTTPWGFVALGVSSGLMVCFVFLHRVPFAIERSHLLAVWNIVQAFLAGYFAASIQTKYGTLRSKTLLTVGFSLMVVAASIRLPEKQMIRAFYLWSYPAILVLSFVINLNRKRTSQ